MKTIRTFLLTALAATLTLFSPAPQAHAAPGDLDALDAAVVGSTVLATAVQPDGKTIIGGLFTSVLGQPRNNIARLNADGTLDAGFNPNANSYVYSVAVQADGRILLGGNFTTVGGTARNLVARLLNDPATQTLNAPDATKLNWIRGGSSPEVSQVAFEKSTDSGATWTPLGSGTRIGTTPNWQLTGISLPATGQLRARGRTTGGYFNGGSGLVEATASYIIDTTPPQTTITSTQPTPTQSTGATIIFTGSDETTPSGGLTYEGRLDGAAFAPVSSPVTLSALADGAHTYEVRARDAANNVDATPASVAWVVDTAPPQTTITSTQPTPTQSTGATFTFTGSDETTLTESLSYEGRLDGAAFAPVSSPVTLSALADGAHTYEVRARDAANNEDASPASVAWVVDTMAPQTTITSGLSGMVNSDSATFTYSADEAAIFRYSLDGAALVADAGPVTFNGLAHGAHTFSVFATDSAGNPDATPATRSWTALLDPVTTVALKGAVAGKTPALGDAVPGAPPGTTFKTFGVPAINDAGTVAFLADIQAGTVTMKAIFVGTEVVARKGAATPIEGTTFASLTDPALNGGGAVAFLAGLGGTATAANNKALYTNLGGALVPVVRKGDAVPGVVKGKLAAITAFQLLDDAVLFSGRLSGVPVSGDSVVCSWTPAAGVQVLLREGTDLGWKRVKTIAALLPAASSPGHGRKASSDAAALARVTFTDGTQAVMEADATGAAIVAQTAGAVPGEPAGAQWKSFGLPAVNRSGGVAFLGTLATGPGGMTSPNSIGLFADTTAGSLAPVVRKGQSVGGLTLGAFKDPVNNTASDVAAQVTLVGAGVTSATAKAILFAPNGGTPALVARTGAEPSGVAGAKWNAFSSFALPDGLGPVFIGKMALRRGVVTAASDMGLWAQDTKGVLRLLAREGATVDVSGTPKTLKSFTVLGMVPGSPGQTRAFNGSRELAYRATFTDNSQAVMRVLMP